MSAEKNKKNSNKPNLHTSELRYRRLFESARDGILILDVETKKITDVNPFMTELLGYTREEFLDKEIWEIGLSTQKEQNIGAFNELIEKGYIRYDNLPLKSKNGEVCEVEFVSNVYEENGRQVIQCNIRDIRQRKFAEAENRLLIEQIEHHNQRLNNIIANIPGVVWESWREPNKKNQRIDFVSEYIEKMLGYSVAEWLSIPNFWLTIIHPDDIESVKKNAALSIETGIKGVSEFRWLGKKGQVVWVEAHYVIIVDQNRNPIGIRAVSIDITGRKSVDILLQKAEAQYRNLVESSAAIVYLAEPSPPFSPIYISPNVTKFGLTTEECFNHPHLWLNLIHAEDRERVVHSIETAMNNFADTDLEYRILSREGKTYWLHDKGRFVFDEYGNKSGWQGIILDITATKELEQQLLQSQKLESVGLLAGGIAHDFNNMLTAINGYSDLTLRLLRKNDPLRRNIEEIRQAGSRAAALTRQLLAFSRRQVLQPVVLNLNEIIAETTKMLQRLIGEDITLKSALDRNLGSVMVDPGQFSQIILNLAVNARDAMPKGGEIIIETANVFLDEQYAQQHIDITPGNYVMISVSDTGIGMNEQTKRHIFDPFFTTKKIGQGTGLGLATVYGIVKQSGGNIEVESEEGIGTTFKIYIPRITTKTKSKPMKTASTEMAQGTETILLVEDEDIVRNLSKAILIECGYTVIEAVNGLHALSLCEEADCKIDLLLTDVVMPQMGGRELSEKLAVKIPNLPVLFTSGYTDDTIIRHGEIESSNFIQKPFTPTALAAKIREILDRNITEEN